jgi:hypothetical protein
LAEFKFQTVTDVESAVLDGLTAGTVTANKAIVAGTNKNVDVLAVADLKLGSGAGTSITSNATELNALDGVGTTAIKVLVHTVSADEQTAGTVSIPAGFTVAGYVCNILRAGVDMTNKASIGKSTTNLVVATNGADYVLTASDVIQAIAWA